MRANSRAPFLAPPLRVARANAEQFALGLNAEPNGMKIGIGEILAPPEADRKKSKRQLKEMSGKRQRLSERGKRSK